MLQIRGPSKNSNSGAHSMNTANHFLLHANGWHEATTKQKHGYTERWVTQSPMISHNKKA